MPEAFRGFAVPLDCGQVLTDEPQRVGGALVVADLPEERDALLGGAKAVLAPVALEQQIREVRLDHRHRRSVSDLGVEDDRLPRGSIGEIGIVDRHRRILADPDFRAGRIDTTYVQRFLSKEQKKPEAAAGT